MTEKWLPSCFSGKETQLSVLKWTQLCLIHVSNLYMYSFQVLLGSLWVKTGSIFWEYLGNHLWLLPLQHYTLSFADFTSRLYPHQLPNDTVLVQAIYTCPKAFILTCILTQFLSSNCFQIVVRIWHSLAPATQCDENGVLQTRLSCNSLSSNIWARQEGLFSCSAGFQTWLSFSLQPLLFLVDKESGQSLRTRTQFF